MPLAPRVLLACLLLLSYAALLTTTRRAHQPGGALPRGVVPAPLVAIADLHGDYHNALRSLQLRHARGALSRPCAVHPS